LPKFAVSLAVSMRGGDSGIIRATPNRHPGEVKRTETRRLFGMWHCRPVTEFNFEHFAIGGVRLRSGNDVDS